MGLNKQKGNMYGWVTHTWNTVKGKCPHECDYCYMKVFTLNDVRFDQKELKTNLGENNIIFVGSSCDMWAEKIPAIWVINTLKHCLEYDNTYLFQSKNPGRFYYFPFPKNIILGTTMESNIDYDFCKAPPIIDRYYAMRSYKVKKMVSIEPIMDFDLDDFVSMIKDIQPSFVSVGADSKGHKLLEPSKDKTLELISQLKDFTEVIVKDNLRRIIK